MLASTNEHQTIDLWDSMTGVKSQRKHGYM